MPQTKSYDYPVKEGCFECGKELTVDNIIRVGCFDDNKIKAVVFVCRKCWKKKKAEGQGWHLKLENISQIGEIYNFRFGALTKNDN